MDLLTISGIILAACGTLILGMAGLLKGMVLDKIQDIQTQLEKTAKEQLERSLAIAKSLRILERRYERLEVEVEMYIERHGKKGGYRRMDDDPIGDEE